jgi:hypothetical protein
MTVRYLREKMLETDRHKLLLDTLKLVIESVLPRHILSLIYHMIYNIYKQSRD